MKLQHLLAALGLALLCGQSLAALDIGEVAPDFTTRATVNGEVFDYSLRNELQKGPVVLYFFPEAFSNGCSIEAHRFAEAIPEFRELGATVVGVSRDDIDVQKKFSVAACRGQFPVASDPQLTIVKSYDALMTNRPDYANRISFVIAPNGKIIYRYSSLNPDRHVDNTMTALREWVRQGKSQ
ncbi:peroxiredoxin Q/BCP [Actimicrobium sp. GrIS 1.19]|uniref:peroxiredoxin n=1 Tax=Actimicrobium sp. GrIS 1.19 TaxID=3071708 RepID=UPI002DFDFC89|nr:peroxiredoxin Q/BCP [Actimicrobium sp. GrIS 1.19]